MGWSMSRGSSARTRLTLSRTSWAPTSAFFSRMNVTKICEMPSADTDCSSSIPAIVLMDSSILSVTSVSTSSGAAPGRRVTTATVGKSTFG